MPEPRDTLNLRFQAADFFEDATAFDARLTAYVADAVARAAGLTDTAARAAAELAWASYRAYADQVHRLRSVLTTGNLGDFQYQLSDLRSRLSSLEADRDAALGEFRTLSATLPDAPRSRSVRAVVEW